MPIAVPLPYLTALGMRSFVPTPGCCIRVLVFSWLRNLLVVLHVLFGACRKPIPIVRPEWVLASIKAGHLLPVRGRELVLH